MKSIHLIPFALLFLLGGCELQDLETLSDNGHKDKALMEFKEVIITAQMEQAIDETRTEMHKVGDKRETWWLPDDKIMIYSAGEASVFTAINDEPVKIAKFKGTIPVITGAEDGTEKDYVWGLYPSSSALGYSEPNGNSRTAVLRANLPTLQKARAGSYADDAAMMIGRSESLGISFKNVYSGFYFLFNREDILSITIKGINGEILAGTVDVTLDSGGLPVSTQVDGECSTEVTLMAPEGGTFEKNTEYYIVMLPVTFSQGLYVTIHLADGREGTYTLLSSNLKMNRSNFRKMNTPDDRISNSENIANGISTGWHASTTQPLNEIWYTTTDNSAVAYVVPSNSNTGNVVDEIIAPSENDGVGIIRFKAPITEIDDEVYWRDSDNGQKLTSVSFSDCVERIGDSAFDSCENLSEVHFGTGLKDIGEWAFSCTDLSEIDLPDGLEYIGNSAFSETRLTSVHIPESVVHLAKTTNYAPGVFGGNPFWYCENLRSFTGKFATPDGRALIETGSDGKKVLVSFATAGMDDATYIVPEVDQIAMWAFCHCTLGQVILPAGLQIISDAAFYYSTNLTSLDIPASVNEICGYAFNQCSKLEYIKINSANIPSMVTSAPLYYYPRGAFNGSHCNIYVPSHRLKYYKNGEYWDAYEERIVGYVQFFDPAFESFMLNNFDDDDDGFITSDEAEDVEMIVYDASDYGPVSNLFGVQYLPNLNWFELDNGGALCSLYYLALVRGLEWLFLNNCDVSNYYPGNNTDLCHLEIIGCSSISSLNLTSNKKLVFVNVSSMPSLNQLSLPLSEELTQLLCYDNALESINVERCPNLIQLNCSNNRIAELYLGNNQKLEKLSCHGNLLTTLDVSLITNLQTMRCTPMNDSNNNNLLSTIYVSSMDQPTANWQKPSATNYVVKTN